MASDKLPHPATNQDTYAYATVTELRRLNANLETLIKTLQDAIVPAGDEPTDQVELKEPEKPAKAAHRDTKRATNKATD